MFDDLSIFDNFWQLVTVNIMQQMTTRQSGLLENIFTAVFACWDKSCRIFHDVTFLLRLPDSLSSHVGGCDDDTAE